MGTNREVARPTKKVSPCGLKPKPRPPANGANTLMTTAGPVDPNAGAVKPAVGLAPESGGNDLKAERP